MRRPPTWSHSIKRAAQAAIFVFLLASCRKPTPPAPASRPSTLPTSVPTTEPTTKPIVRDYPSFLQQRFPTFATSQPAAALHLPPAESAHLKIDQPVFCDSVGELWITDPSAPPLNETLQSASKSDVHFVRETVLFVHRAVNAKGDWEPQLIVKSTAGAAVWIIGDRSVEIPAGETFAWRNAISWNNAIMVSAERAVIRLACEPGLTQQRLAFPATDRETSLPIQLLPDTRGVLAWQACDESQMTGGSVARFVDGQWTMLTGWPTDVVQLLPLLDGGVLTIARDQQQKHVISQNYLDVAAADGTRIDALIDQLSDTSAEAREQASIELARWGASAWPILEKARADQPPEAQLRIARLLENRTHPDLLGFRPKDGPIRMLARRGNSIMIALPNGVTFQRASDDDPVSVAPAVLTLDDHGVRLAPAALTEAALDPVNTIQVCGSEWFATTATIGPRWWVSNHFSEPLLRKSERSFDRVVAIDNGGRLLLQGEDRSATLLIDPGLADRTPRLPVWLRRVEGGATGWTADGWPVMQSGGAWTMTEDQWKPIDESKVITKTPAPSTTAAASRPSSLLTDTGGRDYFPATDGIEIIAKRGPAIHWPMKSDDSEFRLLECAGHLFVFDTPGQLQRFTLPSDHAPLPTLEATFTHRLPTEKLRRLWLDPAGRIDMVFDENGLAICFPNGRIPQKFAELMTAEDLRLANEAAEPTTLP